MTTERETLSDMMASLDRFQAEMKAADEAEEAALAANPWPRWRCRVGWHHPVMVREGPVTGLGHVQRFACGGRCGAWWLSDDLGGPDRQDRHLRLLG